LAKEFGKVTPLPIREVWKHEAQNFTPWLLENAELLGEALGMDLEIKNAEHPVCNYSLDLIGEDVASGETVIIENQLEQSDHSHLGQLLTYAGGTGANVIVWIADSFRLEHRAALEWLNEQTNSDTKFFGVTVSAIQINGTGPVAPLFNVEIKPNEWGKRVRQSLNSAGLTAVQGLYVEFWNKLFARLSDEKLNWTNSKADHKDSWLNLPLGTSGLHYSLNFSKQGARSELYFGSSDPELNAARFEVVQQQRELFEQAYGKELSWEQLPGKKASRVADYLPGASVENTEDWDSYIDWLIAQNTRMRNAFAAIDKSQLNNSSDSI
jgi:hypothetical protein